LNICDSVRLDEKAVHGVNTIV